MEIYARNLFRILRGSLILAKEILVTTTIRDASDVYVTSEKKKKREISAGQKFDVISSLEIWNEHWKKSVIPPLYSSIL